MTPVKNVVEFLENLNIVKDDLKNDLYDEYIKKLKDDSKFLEQKIEDYKKEIDKLFENRLVAFRGHNIYSWKLEPSLYRKGNKKYIPKEHNIINDAIIKYPHDFSSHKTNFEKLAFLQHYQVPTRLLDLTENPLVALYFACSGTNSTQDASVIILSINEDLVKYNNSDSVAILSAMARIDSKKFKHIPKEFEDNIKNESFSGVKSIYNNHISQSIQQLVFNTFCNRYLNATENTKEHINKALNDCPSLKYLLHEIKMEKPHFQQILKLEDFDDRILCVRTKMSNPRIVAQQGLFLLFGIKSSDKLEIPQTNKSKYKDTIFQKMILIDKSSKQDILKELELLGISEDRLFPEFSNSGKSILTKYK